jgi:uncharacterized membrane protein YidH (DUF202 family)
MFQLKPNEERRFINFYKSSAPAQDGAIPLNPKGFFANERTFLHWVNLCVILGAIGLSLVNLSSNPAAVISGIVFVCIAMGFLFYALLQYHYRSDRLEKKEKGKYFEDMKGALVLVFVVFVSVGINFGLHFISQ